MKDILFLDYENFQPANLSLLEGKTSKIFVFMGAKQKKLPLEFAMSAQALGDKVEYVEVAKSAKNAVDFHIAFHLGRAAERDPKSRFVVVSKDRGFETLISHLTEQGLSAIRVASLKELGSDELQGDTSVEDRLAAIVANLRARGAARPRRRKTLENTINAQFMKTLSVQELRDLIQQLCDQDYLTIQNETVTYKQPITHQRKSRAA